MRIIDDVKLDYSDVLFRPKRSTLASRSEVNLEKVYNFKWSPQPFKGIPIMAANMDGVGTIEVAKTLFNRGMFTCLVKSMSYEELIELESYHWSRVAISTGITDDDYNRVVELLNKIPSIVFVCIDVANGYSERFLDFVSKFREKYPNKVIIAGNVVTPDITEELILRGADIVKVGIGPGSVCTTRIKTGVGYPQLSAVIECADAAHGLGGHIIADGGCSCPGDVSKAFGAGADFVMLGGMFAGTDQGGGVIETNLYSTNEMLYEQGGIRNKIEERHHTVFYGMSSKEAQKKNESDLKDYRASEGRVVKIKYRGDINTIVSDILGGLRSTCTYVGAKTLKELPKRTTFVRVNNTHNKIYESITIGD